MGIDKEQDVTAGGDGGQSAINIEAATRAVEAVKEKNIRDGAAEIQEVLTRRKLQMLAVPFLTPDGRTVARIEISQVEG